VTTPAPLSLRRDAEHLAAALPPLLVAAKRLASGVAAGVHGRRRSGAGESFWQYRQALPGDSLATIDWRRSARSDTLFIREREQEAAHTVAFWADSALSMDYASAPDLASKGARASLLALALAILLHNGGERIAFPGTIAADPRRGGRHLQRITRALTAPPSPRAEYGTPPLTGPLKPAACVFFSDFLGPEEQVFAALAKAAENCHSGFIVQVLDPAEQEFPFDGRVIFESMAGGVRFETHRAAALRAGYRARLAARRAALQIFARKSGWHYLEHIADDSPQPVVLAIYAAIGGQV